MDTYADEKEEQKQGKLSSFPKQKELWLMILPRNNKASIQI